MFSLRRDPQAVQERLFKGKSLSAVDFTWVLVNLDRGSLRYLCRKVFCSIGCAGQEVWTHFKPLHTLCPLTTGSALSYPRIRSEQHIKLWIKLPLKSKESLETLCLLCSISSKAQVCLTYRTTWYPSAPDHWTPTNLTDPAAPGLLGACLPTRWHACGLSTRLRGLSPPASWIQLV